MDAETMGTVVKSLGTKGSLRFREIMANQPNFDRAEFNKVVYAHMKRQALQMDGQRYASDKCTIKGHKYAIAHGYQSLYDNGADVPVECVRCGQWDM